MEIVKTLLRVIHQHELWTAGAAFIDEEAITLFDEYLVDVVLLSSGLTQAEEKNLRTCLKEKNSTVIIIQQYGGGSGLLTNEILQAMDENVSMG